MASFPETYNDPNASSCAIVNTFITKRLYPSLILN